MQFVGSIPDSQKIVKGGSTDRLQNDKTMVPNELNYELTKLIVSSLQPIGKLLVLSVENGYHMYTSFLHPNSIINIS